MGWECVLTELERDRTLALKDSPVSDCVCSDVLALVWNCLFEFYIFILVGKHGRLGEVRPLASDSHVVQLLSRVQLCSPMDCGTPDFPVLHHLPDFAQTHVHWVGDAIQSSHPLSSSSPALNLSQHQGLFQWVDSSHQGSQILELQLQTFEWIFRVDFH